jgi:hypothetical protein
MITPENARSYAIFVKQYARNGEISVVNRSILQRQQAQLKLTSAEAEAIERRVLQLLAQASSQSGEPAPSLHSASAPTTSVEVTGDPAIASHHSSAEEHSQEAAPSNLPEPSIANLKRYEQEFTQAISLGLPFSESVQARLVRLQRSLGLQEKDITVIEERLLSQHLTRSLSYLDQPAPSHTTPEQGALEQFIPEQTEPAEPPPTLILPGGIAYVHMAPTAPPAEATSFISTEEMPPEPSVEQPMTALAKSVDAEPVSLRSEKGIDYSALRNLLAEQQWLEADRETLAVMLKAADRAAAGWLDVDALTQFPCLDLHTIDRLWSYYSNGKFGFTAQWQSYPIPKRSRTGFTHSLPSRVIHDQVLEFTKKMDWWTDRLEFFKYHNQLNFSLEAPQGHLPALWFWTIPWWKALQNGGIGAGRGGCSVDNQTLPTFMARLRVCGFE